MLIIHVKSNNLPSNLGMSGSKEGVSLSNNPLI